MNDKTKISWFAVLCILLIIGYQILIQSINHVTYVDPLLHDINGTFVNGWLISHYVVFFLAGYFYPTTFKLAMIIGIIWEICEYIIGYCSKIMSDSLGSWWYGQYQDVIVNLLGFISGRYVNRLLI
jgi:hypothetical protein